MGRLRTPTLPRPDILPEPQAGTLVWVVGDGQEFHCKPWPALVSAYDAENRPVEWPPPAAAEYVEIKDKDMGGIDLGVHPRCPACTYPSSACVLLLVLVRVLVLVLVHGVALSLRGRASHCAWYAIVDSPMR